MDRKSVNDQVLNGFLIAGKMIFGFFVASAFLGSIGFLRLHEAPLPNSFVERHPLFPWECLVGSTVILVLTLDKWAKILPGLLWYGVLGGLIALSAGHYGRIVFTRSEALGTTALFAGGAFLTAKIALRTPTLIDRFALMLFLFCLACSMTSGKDITATLMPIAVGCGVLAISWFGDRVTGLEGNQNKEYVNK